jgi:hypothetical protein
MLRVLFYLFFEKKESTFKQIELQDRKPSASSNHRVSFSQEQRMHATCRRVSFKIRTQILVKIECESGLPGQPKLILEVDDNRAQDLVPNRTGNVWFAQNHCYCSQRTGFLSKFCTLSKVERN